MDLKESAIALHAMGANVLPIRDGKLPAIAWDRLQSERQTSEELSGYDWDKCTGLSIVCGINGFTCFDIDKAEDDIALRAIVTSLGLPEDYRWQARSGSGKGYHLWVKMQGVLPLSNKKGVIKGDSTVQESFKHLELRWKDCQTLVAPSKHVSGGKYEWMYGEPTSAPDTFDANQILEAFGTVATLNDKKEVKSAVYEQTTYSKIICDGVSEGNRNTTVARLAGHYKKAGIAYAETLEIIKLTNNKFTPPLDEKEIITTVESIYSYGTNQIRFYNGAEMKLLKTAAANELVEGIIREHALVFLAGEEGSGKSLTAMNLALAVATGKDYFLNYRVSKHGKVIYLNNELHFEDFNKRFKRMLLALHPNEVSQVANFIVPESMPTLEEIWQQLTSMIEEEKPVMVVLDCLYWAHDKEENDSTEMKALMRRLVELRERFNIVVLVVHHTKKGTRHETMHNDNMRGSSVFGGASDTVLMFKRSSTDETKRLLKPTKLRHGDDESRKVRLLEIDPNTLWLNDLGEADEAEHLPNSTTSGRPTAEDKIDWSTLFGSDTVLQRKEIVDRATIYDVSGSTVDRLLRNALKENTLVMNGHGKYRLQPSSTSLAA